VGVYLRGNAVTLVQRFWQVDPLTEVATPANPGAVVFTVQAPNETETTYTFGVAPEVTNPQVGVFLVALPPPLPAGTYEWRCVGTGNSVDAASEDVFTILESGVLAPTAPGIAEPGPCSGWIFGEDVADCCAGTDVGSDVFLLDTAAAMGAQLMYELSGRQFPGLCQRRVRPCRDGCSCFGHSVAAGLGPWTWDWTGGAGWAWLNECGDRCGCGSESVVRLAGYPVREVLEVKVDGAVVPASGYRLDGWRDLVRLSDVGPPVVGNSWPSCQDMSLPDTAEGTFSILYSWGSEPPELGRRAAAQLACELYKACPGTDAGDCRLPSKVTRVVRQGVTMEMVVPLAKMLREGATGLNLVDAFLAYTNPQGMRRRPAVAQLDRAPYPRRVGE